MEPPREISGTLVARGEPWSDAQCRAHERAQTTFLPQFKAPPSEGRSSTGAPSRTRPLCSTHDDDRFRAYLTVDDEVAVYCPECADREFRGYEARALVVAGLDRRFARG